MQYYASVSEDQWKISKCKLKFQEETSTTD